MRGASFASVPAIASVSSSFLATDGLARIRVSVIVLPFGPDGFGTRGGPAFFHLGRAGFGFPLSGRSLTAGRIHAARLLLFHSFASLRLATLDLRFPFGRRRGGRSFYGLPSACRSVFRSLID